MESSIRSRPRVVLGTLIPRLLLLVFCGDVLMRMERVDWLSFRAWEPLTAYRPPGAAFEPNRRFERARSYGDLAAMANLPALREYRPERFTTDDLGFRNRADPAGRPPAAIMVGDSFVVGSGVTDDETVTSRLGALSGCRVYNAGGVEPHPDRILDLARKVGLEGNLVIHQYAEEYEMPAVPTERRRFTQRALAWLSSRVGGVAGRARGLLEVSPLEILCQRGLKRLENGRLLPNRYAGRIVRGTLVDGDPILFLAYFVGKFQAPREAPMAYWLWLQRELRKGGLDLVVVVVPSKYRVYRRFLAEPPPTPAAAVDDYTDRVREELRRAGIPVIDLTPALSAAAARDLRKNLYLYWRDDIHWNPRGTEVAAAAIREGLGDRLRCARWAIPANRPSAR
jgi:SGNH hydrolase-like domain, acetyltransferase AlgX